ncbi:MAG: tRNA pseudouridine(38-40) synthase TruA [Porticoccaceae bacterium]|nr:tRNA pseudouridine(38-40) synthase TruA [Porticoccaceae bacterium]
MPTSSQWVYSSNCLIPAGEALPAGVRRFAAAVEYRGDRFSGWQRQSHSPSVQQAVESALSRIANQPVTVACAGRTDTGVHATNQVIHFDTDAQRTPRNWLLGANTQLPDCVRLHWVGEMPGDFHSRFRATARTYRYLISNEPVRPALFKGLLTWCKSPLDEARMHRAAQGLLGENDFTSFRAAGCQSRSPNRFMEAISVYRQGALVVIELTANAFLHHMVRNIAGVLMAVGRGERPVEWPAALLAARDRAAGEVTAPADGLYLVSVRYPDQYSLPEFSPGPAFIPL